MPTTPSKDDQPEISGKLLPTNIDYLLTLMCNRWEGYCIIPRYFAEKFRELDPLEEHHHIVDYGAEKVVRIYPIKVWRDSPEKKQIDREAMESRINSHNDNKQKNEVRIKQIQRKRDILCEVRADITKIYRSKGKDILSELGGGATWQIQVENVDYFLYRALSGKNESVRIKLGISQELALEFQELPEDTEWRNRKYQEDRELAKELGEL